MGQNTNASDEQHWCYYVYAKPILLVLIKKWVGYPACLSALASAIPLALYLVVVRLDT